MTTLRRAAVEAKNSDAIDHAVRVGLIAYGVVHLLIAWLILQIAFGETGQNASAQGALTCSASCLSRTRVLQDSS